MNKAVLVLPLVIVSLLAAIWSGWIRIGVDLPVTVVAAEHGGLMVNSFLASLIFLERAVTFRSKWILLLPFVNAGSVVAVFAGYPQLAQLMNIGGSFGFLLMCAWFIYQYKELYYYLFFIGAFCLLTGNIVLRNTALYPAAIIWWMQFLLFTIVAERLELSRFLPITPGKRLLLLVSLSAVLAGAFIPYHLNGNIVFAVALVATAVWLLKYDMAFKSVKSKGQHRYSGSLLITGYFWLIVTAILLVVEKKFLLGYDAVLHSFFIGFVFSMIFSHAPIILPAVAKIAVKIYRPVLYTWFVLLQASLIVRIIADITADAAMRRAAGFSNGVVILFFFMTVAIIVAGELKKKRMRLSKP